MRKKIITLGLALVAVFAMTGCAGMSMPYVQGSFKAGFQPVYPMAYQAYGWHPVKVVKETAVERRRVPNNPTASNENEVPAGSFLLVPVENE